MTEFNLQILDLINENKSLKEIASILKITEKQLYINIREIINYGYSIESEYMYDADIYYKINKRKIMDKINNNVVIKVPTDLKKITCLAISDIHIG